MPKIIIAEKGIMIYVQMLLILLEILRFADKDHLHFPADRNPGLKICAQVERSKIRDTKSGRLDSGHNLGNNSLVFLRSELINDKCIKTHWKAGGLNRY